MRDVIFVGSNSEIRAVDRATGRDLWRHRLPVRFLSGRHFVTLLCEEGVLYAAANGHLYALDPSTGREIWHNQLEGMGHGHVMLASARGASGSSVVLEAQARSERKRANAAVSPV